MRMKVIDFHRNARRIVVDVAPNTMHFMLDGTERTFHEQARKLLTASLQHA